MATPGCQDVYVERYGTREGQYAATCRRWRWHAAAVYHGLRGYALRWR